MLQRSRKKSETKTTQNYQFALCFLLLFSNVFKFTSDSNTQEARNVFPSRRNQIISKGLVYDKPAKTQNKFHPKSASNKIKFFFQAVCEFILLGNLFNLQYPLYEIFHLFLIIPYALYIFCSINQKWYFWGYFLVGEKSWEIFFIRSCMKWICNKSALNRFWCWRIPREWTECFYARAVRE